MNNVSPISKAKRLTEEEVHVAAEELQESGVKVSSIEIYKHLGRGSLTTITNFLRTWHQKEPATTLPALIMLPDILKKSAEQLILKVWAESRYIAEKEINSQREALRQAECVASEKITEAEAFSEEQAKQIEALEAQIEQFKKEIQKNYESYLKEIEEEQDARNKAITNKAVSEQICLGLENQLKKTEEKIAKLEDKITNYKKLEVKTGIQEGEIFLLKQTIESVAQENERMSKENKILREKAAMLEGELTAWKSIKPKAEIKEKNQSNPARNAN